jgi:hypothetical protein
MGFAVIGNVPNTEQEWSDWAFSHQDHHRLMHAYVEQTFGISLPEYVLAPFNRNDPADLQRWLYQHQISHDQQDALIGVSGFNLNSANFNDPNQLRQWIFTNNGLHYDEGQATGVF